MKKLIVLLLLFNSAKAQTLQAFPTFTYNGIKYVFKTVYKDYTTGWGDTLYIRETDTWLMIPDIFFRKINGVAVAAYPRNTFTVVYPGQDATARTLDSNIKRVDSTYLRSDSAAIKYARINSIDTNLITGFSAKTRSLFSATSPVSYLNGIFSMPAATTSVSGYLTSANWNLFNGKLDTAKYRIDSSANAAKLPAPTTYDSLPNRALSNGTTNIYTNGSKWMHASYNINVAYAIVVGIVSVNGLITLDYSTDGGTTWATRSKVSWACSVCVLITGTQDQDLQGDIPPNAKFRIYLRNNTNITLTLPTTKGNQFEKYSTY